MPDFPYIKTHLCHLKKQLSMWTYFLTCKTFLLLTEQFCFTVNLVFLDLYLMQGLVLHGFHVFLSFIGNFAYIGGDFVSALSLHLARKPTRMEAMKNGDNFLLTNIQVVSPESNTVLDT